MSLNEIKVSKVSSPADLEKAFAVRYEVFVEGQGVPVSLEMEFNGVSTHFLATVDDIPAGAARWRQTENGYKLERFAVLDKYRGQGVAQAMVKAVLADIPDDDKPVYLNSQLQAVSLYEKFNFEKSGPEFEEAGIRHYKMVLKR
ncbi:GNAT family N-acetyltransferase [Mucilaginibacter sp. RS28]|uniref:GNAT family N-acetyltransferase n=1 Tax=Mucilaginibacter straminoryzae TaxID=2932774 RepID=A0A9X1X430_9SPHI|nr:GNAT family N-acetyltransferase [Mucilaginibacter straminoryzae]MCJ8209975.1 GNAT family N-acetyltransferase [Mucilaginibacter straminoryzae]